MIFVDRTETPATAGDEAALLASLDLQPGVWMGCDVESEGLYTRSALACAVPALRLCLDGPRLTATWLTASGARLSEAIRPLASFAESPSGLQAHMPTGLSVVELLRHFLAAFHPGSPELALYGALSFDFGRLGSSAPLPDDGRRRLVLYFPERVLSAAVTGAKWIDFRFSGTNMTNPAGAAVRSAAIVPAQAGIDTDELAPGAHATRVGRGIEMLRRGMPYSLVLSQAFRRRTQARASRAFAALRRRNPYPAMFFCNLGGGEVLFGASPDVQVRADTDHVESAPVCGTYRRGADPVEDAEQALALLSSDKESAALALCADSAANDLAAVCEPGSIELVSHRRPHYFSTIIHAIDHLRGCRHASADGFAILLAHAYPATVTGLPKPDAVRAIEALEGEWRGWYAGAVARIGTDGSVDASTVLRAARIVSGIAEIRTGGNVLVDSDPQAEEEETRLKAQTLFSVLEEAGATGPAGPASGRDWSIRIVDSGDPFQLRLNDALVRAGGRLDDAGGICVVSGEPRDGQRPPEPLLAIGDGAIWVMRTEGAVFEKLPVPVHARNVHGHAREEDFLGDLGRFQAGWYATEVLRADALPPAWQLTAHTADGWVLAARHRTRRVVLIMFRPDSILSLRASTGVRALRAAFGLLEPCDMFSATIAKEKSC